MSEIIKYQGAIKRLLDNYLSASYIKGDVYKAAPTIIRGTGHKTQQKSTYSGQYKIFTTKNAWNAVEIHFMNYRNSPKEFETFVNPMETLLNTKFNLPSNTNWFSKSDFTNGNRFIIREDTIKENLINIRENKMNRENLKHIVKLVNEIVSKKLNEFIHQ